MDQDLAEVLRHIEATVGSDSTKWPPPPVGYPEASEAALLDAVFSLQAVYGQAGAGRAPTGAYKVVANWRGHVGRPLNSLAQFVVDVDNLGGRGGTAELAEVLDNRQVAVPSSVDQPTKALAVYVVAKALSDMNVDTVADVRQAAKEWPKELVKAIKSAQGVGVAATTYFLMNLKIPGVKVDTMVHRFVKDALDRKVSFEEVGDLVTRAAATLPNVDLLHLDHTIWKHGSDAARSRKRRRSKSSG